MNVINISQRSTEWHAWRTAGVTASEAAVILGRSPYKSAWRLWAERTGLTAPEDLSAKPCVQRGIALEDQARQAFEERHGTILLPLCGESEEHPVLRCSLDGLSDDEEPVELKVPMDRTCRLVASEREQSLAYRLYWVQVQHQLYVAGAARGWLVFDPCRPGSPAVEFTIERDERFQQSELVPACLAFWEAIETGKAPPQDPDRDLYVPANNALAQWREAASEYKELAAERRDLEDSLKRLKERMKQTESAFVGLMGEHLLADTQGFRITRYLQNGSVDYKALLHEIAPDLDAAVLERHRRKPSERLKVSVPQSL